MSKVQFTQEIRDEYKQKARYIRTKAEINLGGQRPGVNLLPTSNFTERFYSNPVGTQDMTLTCNNWDFKLTGYDTTGFGVGYVFTLTEPLIIPAGTYTLTMIRDVSQGNQSSTSYYSFSIPYKLSTDPPTPGSYRLFSISSGRGVTTEKLYISKTITFDIDQVITGTDGNYLSLNIERTGTSASQEYNESFKLMLNEGTEPWPWWEGGSSGGLVDDIFTFGEDGICEILDFKVDETSDIYYEKMPYSELTINTDNNKGYFNDFGDNSIVNKLTKDVVMNFYLNVNDTGWIKTWTMQFDSLKADNDKATLIFKPYCLRIFNSELYDIDRDFYNYSSLPIYSYIYYNYGVNVSGLNTNASIDTNGTHIYKNISDILTAIACDLNGVQRPQLIRISDNKFLAYKDIQYTTLRNTDENITSNEILEKPLITKEELQGVIINYKTIQSTSQETKAFQKSITSIFKKNVEALVIFCDNFDASGITQNDISLTNATLNWFGVSNDPLNIASRYLIVEIQGNIGGQYTINIDAELNTIQLDNRQETFLNSQDENKSNVMQIEGFKNGLYWLKLKDNMKKKIKLKIIGLPYLQVGDSITYEEEGKVVSIDDKVIITEIHTSWNNGFIMNIVAYKVYEVNPGELYPYDTLYPSDTLYPR